MNQKKEPFFELTPCSVALAFLFALPIVQKSSEELRGESHVIFIACFIGFLALFGGISYALIKYVLCYIMRKAYEFTAKGLKLNFDRVIADEVIACGLCAACLDKITKMMPETIDFGDAFAIKAWLISIIGSIIFLLIQLGLVHDKQNATVLQSIIVVLATIFAPLAILIGIAVVALKM